MANLNIRIPDSFAERLGQLAEITGRTKSYYIRQMLEQQLEEYEDTYLAMQVYEKVRSGRSRVWTQEEVEQERDLED